MKPPLRVAASLFCTYWLFQPYGVDCKLLKNKDTPPPCKIDSPKPCPTPALQPLFVPTGWIHFFPGYRLHICFLNGSTTCRQLLDTDQIYCPIDRGANIYIRTSRRSVDQAKIQRASVTLPANGDSLY